MELLGGSIGAQDSFDRQLKVKVDSQGHFLQTQLAPLVLALGTLLDVLKLFRNCR